MNLRGIRLLIKDVGQAGKGLVSSISGQLIDFTLVDGIGTRFICFNTISKILIIN